MSRQRQLILRLSQVLISMVLLSNAWAADLEWKGVTNLEVRGNGKVENEALVFQNERNWMAMIRLPDANQVVILETQGERVGTLPATAVRFSDHGDVLLSSEKPAFTWISSWRQRGPALVFEALGKTWELAPATDLVGEVTTAELLAFSSFYPLRLDAFQPHAKATAFLKQYPRKARLTLFFGTWCSLCADILPKWLKTLMLAENPNLEVRLVGLNENLTQPAAFASQYKPKTVPTLVLEMNGREMGRIEGLPQVSAEADLVALLVQGLGRK